MPTPIQTTDQKPQGASSEGTRGSRSRTGDQYVHTALRIASQTVEQEHPQLRATLLARPTLSELLGHLAKAVEFDTSPVVVPGLRGPLPEEKRRVLRAMALQSVEDDKVRVARCRSSFPTQTILSHGLLESAGLPRSLTPEQRERLKACMEDVLAPRGTPRPHFMINPRHEAILPGVECSISIAAIDHEDPMPRESLRRVALWATGAAMTCVTDDVLPYKFQRFIAEDGAHDPYRFEGGTRVHFSCLVEFSNGKVVQFDTVAVVVPRAEAPNGRSGVILGQRGLIDCLRYESVPRRVAVVEDPEFPEDRWGRFDVKCYRGLDGEVQRFERVVSMGGSYRGEARSAGNDYVVVFCILRTGLEVLVRM